MPRVLCVDDDREKAIEIGEYFSHWDSPYGEFTVEIETDFASAIERLRNERFDIVTLDLHGSTDPDPIKDNGEQEGQQEGKRVLDALRNIRFVPVIFYTGYAHKISGLETGVVKIVKKGSNDLQDVRDATTSIYKTGLPDLLRHIENEKRTFIWDTVDRLWEKMGADGSPEDLAYLLARRLAARFNRESVKALLNHKIGAAKPIEMYIYPHIDEPIKTGCILQSGDEDDYWIVVTPACDFSQAKADAILLVGTFPLTEDLRYIEWATHKWKGNGKAPSNNAEKGFNRLNSLLKNNGGDRYRFLPKTFFLPDLVIDLQKLRQISLNELSNAKIICRLDSPYREELLVHVSRYYGRMGTPDLLVDEVFNRL